MKILLIIIITITLSYSNGIEFKLIKRGKRVAKVFCNKDLPKNVESIKELEQIVKNNNICSKLSKENLKALYLYINKQNSLEKQQIDVPKSAKCPVCGMFVSKYPKWAALMVVNNQYYYFDGIKDMMKFYFFDKDFKYDRDAIKNMKVTNYYTLEAIDAKNAFYVYDSKVYGPMGREVIAFKNKKEAKNFIKDHGGKLLRFEDLTPKNIMALDGVDLE